MIITAEMDQALITHCDAQRVTASDLTLEALRRCEELVESGQLVRMFFGNYHHELKFATPRLARVGGWATTQPR
jgi:hypothetical protein